MEELNVSIEAICPAGTNGEDTELHLHLSQSSEGEEEQEKTVVKSTNQVITLHGVKANKVKTLPSGISFENREGAPIVFMIGFFPGAPSI